MDPEKETDAGEEGEGSDDGSTSRGVGGDAESKFSFFEVYPKHTMAKEDDEEDNYSSSDEENFFDNPEEEEVEGEDEQDEETGDNQKSEKDLQLQRESRKEQKIKQVERRLQKPHADIILDAKRIWEKLR